jgi:preprotein translocase subunit SecY
VIGSAANIHKIPELRKRILFSLLFLAIYRIGVAIPTPGVNGAAIAQFFEAQSRTVFGLFNMFSGGALEQMSVFALGIMPYISASIILQLLTVVIPSLERLSKEGDAGRRKITQYTRYGTVLLSLVQGFGIATAIENMSPQGGLSVVYHPGIGFKLMTVLTLTAGTAFIMWLGEQITERGIGNGISLIIFANIVARMPSAGANMIQALKTGNMQIIAALALIAFMVFVIGAIIFCERGQRRIPVQYAKRVVGRKVYGGQATHLPLKINTSGVIPPIFASSILMFPATISSFVSPEYLQSHEWLTTILNLFNQTSWLYNVIFAIFVVFFCYFYTAVTFNPTDVADNMKRYGGYIPGIRPGKKTADFIDHILSRITLGGAIYISAICILPSFLMDAYKIPFYFGGTSLLIVVGVALDTVAQIESHLINRSYEGLMGQKGGRIRGRKR